MKYPKAQIPNKLKNLFILPLIFDDVKYQPKIKPHVINKFIIIIKNPITESNI